MKPAPTAFSAFTILEMLIAATIMSFLMLILFTGFNQGQRGWVHGEKRARAFQDGRRLLSGIANEVGLALTSSNRTGIRFRGDSQNLYFVAPLSNSEGFIQTNNTAVYNRNEVVDLCWVAYKYVPPSSGEAAGCMRREATPSAIGTIGTWSNQVYGASATAGLSSDVLASNVVLGAWFRYARPDGAGDVNAWPTGPYTSLDLPRAVRIHIETIDADTARQIAANPASGAALKAANKRVFETQVYLVNSR